MGRTPSCCVFTATNLPAQDPFASLRRPRHFWPLSTPTEHRSCRDSTIHALLRHAHLWPSNCTKLLICSCVPSSSHQPALLLRSRLGTELLACILPGQDHLDRYSLLGSSRRPDGSFQNVQSHLTCRCIMPRTDVTSSDNCSWAALVFKESTTPLFMLRGPSSS